MEPNLNAVVPDEQTALLRQIEGSSGVIRAWVRVWGWLNVIYMLVFLPMQWGWARGQGAPAAWESAVEAKTSPLSDSVLLSNRGKEGWQLVAVSEDQFYFQRPAKPQRTRGAGLGGK